MLSVDRAVDIDNSIAIQNLSVSGFAYIGDANVSDTNFGFKLSPGQTISMDLGAFQHVFAVGDGIDVAVIILDKS